MATVKEIQVCGGRIHKTLYLACQDYLDCIDKGIDREKMHFSILLANGETRTITIRETDDGLVAYGDFAGLPNALEWSQGKE